MTKLSATVQFPTGARRSGDAESERFDLITPFGLRRFAQTCAEGAAKRGHGNASAESIRRATTWLSTAGGRKRIWL